MSLSRLIIFFTTFGSTLFLQISLQNHNKYLAFVGAVILLAGFSYIAKFAKKPAVAAKEA